jgi:hypothetical protein
MTKAKEKSKVSEPKKQSKSVTLKRNVVVKVVVTDKFKEYMHFEIKESLKRTDARLLEIEKMMTDLSGDASQSGVQVLIQQLSAEKVQLEKSREELSGRTKLVDELKINTFFNQGTVDGFVSVSEGDNLYEKLGGMEILLKDGVVQKINPVADTGIKP